MLRHFYFGALGVESPGGKPYVSQKGLESVREKVKLGNDVGEEEVKNMVFPERLQDTDMMVPVDMSKVPEELVEILSRVKVRFIAGRHPSQSQPLNLSTKHHWTLGLSRIGHLSGKRC